jgi:hypothetical protein
MGCRVIVRVLPTERKSTNPAESMTQIKTFQSHHLLILPEIQMHLKWEKYR